MQWRPVVSRDTLWQMVRLDRANQRENGRLHDFQIATEGSSRVLKPIRRVVAGPC